MLNNGDMRLYLAAFGVYPPKGFITEIHECQYGSLRSSDCGILFLVRVEGEVVEYRRSYQDIAKCRA